MNKAFEKFIFENDFNQEDGVGIAKHSDLPEILKMILNMPKESEGLLPEANAAKMSVLMEKEFYNHPLIVYREEGEVVGALALTEGDFWWSEKGMLSDLFFYVKPDNRTYKATRSLLSKASEYARIKGVPLIIGIFSRKDLDRKRKVLERNGFEMGGSLFICNHTEE